MTHPFPLAARRAALATMHGKERAIVPVLARFGLDVHTAVGIDTDRFGTFTRDVPRAGSQREALLAKAQAALETDSAADYGVASEGAFGPHPAIPFVPTGLELVALLDRRSGQAVVGRHLTTATNFAQAAAHDPSDVAAFAARIGFPGHALVVMASAEGPPIAKGVTDEAALSRAVAPVLAGGGAVWLEADMRAHLNPMRMRAITGAAADLARRLEARCPRCAFPDWLPEIGGGRPCRWCGTATDEGWIERLDCGACGLREERTVEPERLAEPGRCPACNP